MYSYKKNENLIFFPKVGFRELTALLLLLLLLYKRLQISLLILNYINIRIMDNNIINLIF